MRTMLRRFAPSKKIVIMLNLVLLVLAILASFARGSFNAVLLLCFVIPIWAVASGSSAVRNMALWGSGLLVGSSFLIGTIGTYSELSGGEHPGGSLGIAAILLLLALPTFLHLYYNQPDASSIAADEGGASLTDEALHTVRAEATRQSDDAARIAEERLPKGICPNCRESIPLASQECKSCKASFGPHSKWRVLPAIDA